MPSLALLIIGIIPLIYVAILIRRYGIPEALSLRPVGVVFIWIGYHLSPWLYFATGQTWDHFLLVPEHINTALGFSTISSLFFLIGYSYIFNHRLADVRGDRMEFESINVSPLLVALLVGALLLVVIVLRGGITELWSASTVDWGRQFEERHGAAKIIQVLGVARMPLTLAATVTSGFLILGSTRSKLSYWVGLFSLGIAVLSSLSVFSRAAGFPLILFAFMALRMKGKGAIWYALLLVAVAVFLGSVGLNYRHEFYPGIGNFLVAAGNALVRSMESSGGWAPSAAQFVNPLDATAPFTRIVELGVRPGDDPLLLALMFFWNLNPLPSEFVPLFEIGESLTDALGTWGNTGLTTPALAEIYRVFGYLGSSALFLIGMLCGWCERRTILRPSVLSSLNSILFFAAFPLSLHSATRAMTRPFVYGIAMVLVARFRWKTQFGRSSTWHGTAR